MGREEGDTCTCTMLSAYMYRQLYCELWPTRNDMPHPKWDVPHPYLPVSGTVHWLQTELFFLNVKFEHVVLKRWGGKEDCKCSCTCMYIVLLYMYHIHVQYMYEQTTCVNASSKNLILFTFLTFEINSLKVLLLFTVDSNFILNFS